jgi:hypothetical protein
MPVYSLFHSIQHSWVIILLHHLFVAYIFKIRRNVSGFISSRLKFCIVETHDFHPRYTHLTTSQSSAWSVTCIRFACENTCNLGTTATMLYYAVRPQHMIVRPGAKFGSLLSERLQATCKIQTIIFPAVLYGCETSSHTGA